MKILALLVLLTSSLALAQTAVPAPTCSVTSPCVAISATMAQAAATEVTTKPTATVGASETAGPINLTLMKCVGSTAGCGTVAAPGVNGWVAVGTNPTVMTTPTVTVTDPEPAGTLVNYSAQAAWADPIYGTIPTAWSTPISVTVTVATTPPVNPVPTAPNGTPGITLTVTTTMTTTVAPSAQK
jgi:hypothetical protein